MSTSPPSIPTRQSPIPAPRLAAPGAWLAEQAEAGEPTERDL
ncbi:MAG: hypothetical protein P1V81_04255 [Planctomycetota bacterium]|nr:hypothetical protein [Planctomycetota bacterium]